jgi:hypothetical protein
MIDGPIESTPEEMTEKAKRRLWVAICAYVAEVAAHGELAPTPELADAIEALAAVGALGALLQPTDAMIEAGVEALEGVPELDAHEFVRVIVAAVARAGWIERGGRPDSPLAPPPAA